MHLLVGGWVGGLATLVVHVLSFRVLTCVFALAQVLSGVHQIFSPAHPQIRAGDV